jgi:hypothetical protein
MNMNMKVLVNKFILITDGGGVHYLMGVRLEGLYLPILSSISTIVQICREYYNIPFISGIPG